MSVKCFCCGEYLSSEDPSFEVCDQFLCPKCNAKLRYHYMKRGVSIKDCIDIFFQNLKVDLEFDIAQDYQYLYIRTYFPEIEKRFKELKEMVREVS